MDFETNDISVVVRWAMPIFGLAVSLLAWRRFGTPGTLLVCAGFLLMLIGPAYRFVFLQLWDRDSSLRAQDVALILSTGAFISAIGGVLLIIAMRRLIRAAAVREQIEALSGRDDT